MIEKVSKTNNFLEISIFFLKFSLVLVIMLRFDWKKHRERIISNNFNLFSSILPNSSWFCQDMIEKSIENGYIKRNLYLFPLFCLNCRDIAKIKSKKASKTDNFNEIYNLFSLFYLSFIDFAMIWSKQV